MPAEKTPADPRLDAVHRAMAAAEQAVADTEQHVVAALQRASAPPPAPKKKDEAPSA